MNVHCFTTAIFGLCNYDLLSVPLEDAVFCQKYSDTLLKNLPDIKTIIGLRQQLVSKKPLGTSDAIDGEQTPEQVAKTEGK